MHEATNLIIAKWARSYFHASPIIDHRLSDLPFLFFIAWVFNMEDEFQQVTRQMQYKTVGSIIDSVASFPVDLPILHSSIQKLERAKREKITRVIEIIRQMIATPLIDSAEPSAEVNHKKMYSRRRCDRVVLDGLISAASQKDIWPLDVAQSLVDTSSFFRIAGKATTLDFTTECERLLNLHTIQTGVMFEVDSSHRIKNEIQDGVTLIERRLMGLKLKRERARFDLQMLETHL
ncbi:uncharacterized protein EAE97_002683 [Botrytis byssoidea]|uniref:Uncharacterized protein n=1 Tax=Botrytis byssoidea TaxID=139641 RepID=A0A9P5IWE4_9HELO|nr:uncharacterized protein EAE97_002683 [Botrytis byssoidea]KAF7951132.1 hypothetical protein EAE97_002683 [Botrytis byssoidea]